MDNPAVPGTTAHWSQDRLTADVNRAVGGSINLIREFCRLSFDVDPATSVEWMIKRTQFFAYELQSLVSQDELDEQQRLDLLNRYFFDSKRFKCIENLSGLRPALNAVHFGRSLVDRSGSPVVITVLYRFFAEKIGLNLEIVDFHPLRFLRWTDCGRARFVDITRKGAILSSDELIDCLRAKLETPSASPKSVLEVSPFELVVSDYILDLKRSLNPSEDTTKLLHLQNALVSYQPSNVHLLGERAMLHRKLGQLKNALSDLKRYFTFVDKAKATAELQALHEELLRLTARLQT